MDISAPFLAKRGIDDYHDCMAPIAKPRFCRKCEGPIPASIKIKGRRRSLQPRKYCLECSPWGAGNSQQLEKIRTDGLKTCVSCKKDYPAKSYGRNGLCKKCLADKARIGRWELKRKCVEFLGGKCVRCGYHRCLAALDFHHRDPEEKDFEIGSMRWTDLDRLKPELLKCDLLCRNCHAEEHFLEAEDELAPALPLSNATG